MSTSTVTSQTPTLHWALASGTDGARVQICHDRACGTVEQTLDVTGTSAAPTTALTPGVHYWRLYGRSGTTVAGSSGPVWQFYVGHLSAPHDTSWGTTPDFNGDGYADVLVGANGAYVYAGGASGPATTPTVVSVPAGSMGFGQNLAAAGDFNGDG